jgi:hypothetical protein
MGLAPVQGTPSPAVEQAARVARAVLYGFPLDMRRRPPDMIEGQSSCHSLFKGCTHFAPDDRLAQEGCGRYVTVLKGSIVT